MEYFTRVACIQETGTLTRAAVEDQEKQSFVHVPVGSKIFFPQRNSSCENQYSPSNLFSPIGPHKLANSEAWQEIIP